MQELSFEEQLKIYQINNIEENNLKVLDKQNKKEEKTFYLEYVVSQYLQIRFIVTESKQEIVYSKEYKWYEFKTIEIMLEKMKN
jgi:hypothetical protein